LETYKEVHDVTAWQPGNDQLAASVQAEHTIKRHACACMLHAVAVTVQANYILPSLQEQAITMRAALLALLLLGCAAAVHSADIAEYYKGQGPKQSHYVSHVKGDDGPNGGFYRSEQSWPCHVSSQQQQQQQAVVNAESCMFQTQTVLRVHGCCRWYVTAVELGIRASAVVAVEDGLQIVWGVGCSVLFEDFS
jgi:hypothetical protein